MFGDERTDWFGVRLGYLSFMKTFDAVDISQKQFDKVIFCYFSESEI
jgi:hypothetical protein